MNSLFPVEATKTRWLSLFLFLFAPVAFGQNASAALADALRQHVLHKRLILRNFSAEPVVHAQAHRDGVIFAATQTKSFSLIQFTDVNASKQRVTLRGTKEYVLRKTTELASLPETEDVSLTLEVDPDLPQEAFDATVSGLFFPRVSAALAALPPGFARMVPAKAEELERPSPRKNAVSVPATQICDCSQHGTPACAGEGSEAGWSPPVLVKQTEQQMPPGTQPGFTLRTAASIDIGADGHVGELWILFASNQGTAVSAAAAINKYKFRPATCHGAPVDSQIVIDTTFERH